MAREEASPEAIGAIRKYCVVAGTQDSQVSSLGRGSFRFWSIFEASQLSTPVLAVRMEHRFLAKDLPQRRGLLFSPDGKKH